MLQRLEARLAEGVTTARAGAVLAAGAAAGAAAGMVAARVAGWRDFTMVGPYPNLATATDAVQGMQLDTGQLGPMLSIHVATEYPHEVNNASRHLSTDTDSVVPTRSPDAAPLQASMERDTSSVAAVDASAAATAAGSSSTWTQAAEAALVDTAVPCPIAAATSCPLSAPQGITSLFNTNTSPESISPPASPTPPVFATDVPSNPITSQVPTASGTPPGFTNNSEDPEHLTVYNTDTAPTLTNASGGFDNAINPDTVLHRPGGGSTYQDLVRTLPLPESSSDANSPPPASDLDRSPHWSDLDEAEDAVASRANVAAGETDDEMVGPSVASESGVHGLLAGNSATTDTPDESEEEVEEEVDDSLEDDPPEPDPDDEAFLSL